MLTENIIKRIDYNNWWDFTNVVKEKETSIFRGHSNFHYTKNGIEGGKEWEIISAFNRAYPNSEIQRYPYQEFWDRIEFYKKDNKILNDFDGDSLLSKLQFFQHYGIPTPLIDFTRNPLTALFFATSGLPYHGVMEIDANRYITIIEINTKLLNDDYNMKEITNQNIHFDSLSEYIFGSDHRRRIGMSIRNPNILGNKNLSRQEGAFIYFDCEYPLEQFLGELNLIDNFSVSQAPITFHNIKYNSFRGRRNKLNHPNLFYFLTKNKKIGMYLFNDMQGVKYDYNNPYILSALACMDKVECDCSRTLLEYGITI